MEALAAHAREDGRVYFTGGATAVLYSQAFAKAERGHAQDVVDVREMLRRGMVDRGALRPHRGRAAEAAFA